MRRNLSFYRLQHNGQRWYATCAEYGPYTEPEAAISAADALNRKQTAEQKKRSRAVVMDWRKRKTLGGVQ